MTPLHLAASIGFFEELVETLLDKGASGEVLSSDSASDTALHRAVSNNLPMAAYQISSRFPAACLIMNSSGQTPIDISSSVKTGEVSNALLLGCAHRSSPDALQAMENLLHQGAVADTWAPSGLSTLMIAASHDNADAVALLIRNGASLELKDSLGRTALMIAVSSSACGAVNVLVDAKASVAEQDKKGKRALDYAIEGSEVYALLKNRITELEKRAAEAEQELLAELMSEDLSKKQTLSQSKKKSKAGKKKKGKAVPRLQTTAHVGVVGKEEEEEVDFLEKQESPRKDLLIMKPEPHSNEDEEKCEWQLVGGGREERIPRIPRVPSADSTCSGESHETDASRLSGSERSVLRHHHRSDISPLDGPINEADVNNRDQIRSKKTWESRNDVRAIEVTTGDADSGAHRIIAQLRAQIASLQESQKNMELRHQAELAGLLREFQQYQRTSIEQAIAQERMDMAMRLGVHPHNNGIQCMSSRHADHVLASLAFPPSSRQDAGDDVPSLFAGMSLDLSSF